MVRFKIISLYIYKELEVGNYEIVGHVLREISRFCHFYINYGGTIEARVRETKYRPSPIPSGGLEIPVLLIFKILK